MPAAHSGAVVGRETAWSSNVCRSTSNASAAAAFGRCQARPLRRLHRVEDPEHPLDGKGGRPGHGAGDAGCRRDGVSACHRGRRALDRAGRVLSCGKNGAVCGARDRHRILFVPARVAAVGAGNQSGVCGSGHRARQPVAQEQSHQFVVLPRAACGDFGCRLSNAWKSKRHNG